MIQNPNEIAARQRMEEAMSRIEANVRTRLQMNRRQFICGSAATMALAMLGLAGREILWSLVFVFPVYALFLWVFRRVPKKTVL